MGVDVDRLAGRQPDVLEADDLEPEVLRQRRPAERDQDLLPDRLTAVADNRPRITELSLWDSPYLFVFVLACLGAEWGLRKRFGLA